jgi:HlyD family secretion protein
MNPGWRRPTVLLLALVLFSGCQKKSRDGAIHSSGHIEATEVRLAAKVGGRLVELPFQEGDTVKAGDVVARIDTTDAQIELRRAEAELAAADARLRLLLAGTRVEDIQRVEAEVSRTEADLANAETDKRRLEGLAEKGTATMKARDDSRTRVLMLSRTVAGQKAELHKLKSGARAEEIDAARAQKRVTEAVISAISQKITDSTVLAPRAGLITQRTTEPGEILPAGAVVSVLTDTLHPWLNAYVDQPVLSRIKLGDPVKVHVDGRDHDYLGKITYVSEVAEFTPKNVQTPEERAKLVFKIKIGLDNAGGVFKSGMPADAYFEPTAK